MKAIVRIPEARDHRKKSWRKLLEKVDKEQSNGYAFVGSWLRGGDKAELAVGSHVLCYDESGSTKNWHPEITLYRVTESGLEELYQYEGETRERAWALGCRDEIAEIINTEQDAPSPLAEFFDEDILAEAKRRGLV
ncbi:MAG: hypothetical protein K9J79_03775 [Desulfobacteraceae bacterium]|nr:hypothetical protein [Desulfobacteraceae bacterium]